MYNICIKYQYTNILIYLLICTGYCDFCLKGADKKKIWKLKFEKR